DDQQLVDLFSNVVLRRAAGGSVQHMLSGLGTDNQLALVDSSHGARYPLLAMPNNTVATVDDTGAIDGEYSYDPYGAMEGRGVADYPFLFAGRTSIGAGIYYYRARYYDSVSSRFLSSDPIGLNGGSVNLNVYAGGNPIEAMDPNGMELLNYLGPNDHLH